MRSCFACFFQFSLALVRVQEPVDGEQNSTDRGQHAGSNREAGENGTEFLPLYESQRIEKRGQSKRREEYESCDARSFAWREEGDLETRHQEGRADHEGQNGSPRKLERKSRRRCSKRLQRSDEHGESEREAIDDDPKDRPVIIREDM